MKKLWVGLAGLLLFMGTFTAGIYASKANNDVNGNDNESFYEQMLPYAKQMHPDATDQQIENMYNSCHSNKRMGDWNMMN
ncbi:FAD/FMN-containing dehydrogenase [Paenibacillus sp. CMAA1364]